MIEFDTSSFRAKTLEPYVLRSYWLPVGLWSLLTSIASAEGTTAPYLVRKFCEQLEAKWQPKETTEDDKRFLAAVRAGARAAECKIFTVRLQRSTIKRIEECAAFYRVSRSLLIAAMIAEAVRSYAELKKQPEYRVDLIKLELLPKLEKDQAAA